MTATTLAFKKGAFQAVLDLQLPPGKMDKIVDEIFLDGERSDWEDMLERYSPKTATNIGYQFVCILAFIRPKDRESATHNLFRFMTESARLSTKKFQQN